MHLITSPGLVLRRKRHQENDLYMTVLFRDMGKVLVLAKGGLKFSARLKALQEPFTEADFQVSLPVHGHYARLIGGKLRSSHHVLTRHWDVFMTAMRCCETVEVLLPFRAPSADVFDNLRTTLQELGTSGSPSISWIMFGSRLLSCLGYGDVSLDLLRLLQPKESSLFRGSVLDKNVKSAWPYVTSSSLNRCQAYIDARISQLLPWPLKSEALV